MLFLCSGLSTYPRFRVSPWNFQLNPNFSVGTEGQGRRGHHDDRDFSNHQQRLKLYRCQRKIPPAVTTRKVPPRVCDRIKQLEDRNPVHVNDCQSCLVGSYAHNKNNNNNQTNRNASQFCERYSSASKGICAAADRSILLISFVSFFSFLGSPTTLAFFDPSFARATMLNQQFRCMLTDNSRVLSHSDFFS